MRRTLGIIVVAFAVVSCGSSEPGETATAPPSPSPTSGTVLVAEGSYASIEAMMKAVESTFYLCNAPIKIYDPPTDDDALAQADCSDIVSFYIYEPGDVQPNIADLQADADEPAVLLFGENWIITCTSNQAVCERVQGGTGGELIVGTS